MNNRFGFPNLCQFCLLLLCAVASTLCSPPGRAQTDTAYDLLASMSRALRELDYRGLFTYEYGGALKTLRITHQVTDGVEYEHLEHLNGPPIRVERSGSSTDCLPPADKLLRGLIPDPGGGAQGLNQHYYFRIIGEQRIAERQAAVLQILPRDAYRYGYTISIDRETTLPLAAMTVNASNRALERIQFLSLDLQPSDEWVELVNSGTRLKRPAWPLCGGGTQSEVFDWKVSWVPSGFIPAGQTQVQDVGEVSLFTDGLSAFSVFVRPLQPDVTAQGKAQRGATVAYLRQVEFNSIPYTITVVGEIPARTAQRVAASVLMPAAPGEDDEQALETDGVSQQAPDATVTGAAGADS